MCVGPASRRELASGCVHVRVGRDVCVCMCVFDMCVCVCVCMCVCIHSVSDAAEYGECVCERE
jgi:hypothetical protein